jgi:CBS domain-containing membrane protein
MLAALRQSFPMSSSDPSALRGAPAGAEVAPASPALHQVLSWLLRLWPAPVPIDTRERLRIVVGVGLGLLLTAVACRGFAVPGVTTPWLVAPLGASALLVFAVPNSPMAQPWSVVAGNTVSALVGIAMARLIPDVAAASALAVAGAVVAMFALRCLHPPGGATALLMVLTHTTAFDAAFFPVFANSALLVAIGAAYNTLTGHDYPHQQRAPKADRSAPASRFTPADLDAALARRNELLDISRDDLEALLVEAEAAAYRRNLLELRCGDVMTASPQVVHFGTPLLEAWGLMRRGRIKALPVVDRARRVVGIVTTADFIRLADLDQPVGLAARLKGILRPSGAVHSDRPEAVGQVMTRQVRVVNQATPVAEPVPLFASSGHHHLPVLDDERRIVGILTQSDLVRALHQSVAQAP